MQTNPFIHEEFANLTNFGFDPSYFKFIVTTLQSEKYVCIKDKDAQDTPQISIIQLTNKMNIVKRPGHKIDGALMHISQNIISLKAPNQSAGHILQIFNLNSKSKLKHIELSESIVFWRWVNANILGVVTINSVYHVNISNDSKEVKVFDRAADLKDNQIIGYALDPDEKWGALFGISSPDGGKTINGRIQLYFIESGKQQLLEGHACTFGRAYLHNETHKSNIFCFVERKANEKNSTVHITEISAPPQGIKKFKKSSTIIYDNEISNDFPIAMIIAEKYGILYIITKFGLAYLYEISTCEQIYKTRLSTNVIFAVAKNYVNDGILAIAKNGSLYGALIDENNLVNHLLSNCKHIPNIQQLAYNLASRYNLPGVNGISTHQFNKFLVQKGDTNAAKFASLQNNQMIRKAIFKHEDNKQTILDFEGKGTDYDAVWEIFRQVIASGDTYVFHPNTPKRDLEKNWFASYMHTYIYEDENGQVLGTYIIKPNQPDLGSHIANASFMVNPKFHGKGIGSKMCEHCLKQAKDLGFKAMQFNIVVSTNAPALAVWKKFGFQIIGTIPEAFHNLKLDKLVDAYIMYRKL